MATTQATDAGAGVDRGREAVANQRLVFGTAVAFTIGVLIHNADHLRRGVESLSGEVYWVGSSAMVLEVAIVVLACARHRLAPLAACLGGFGLALGYFVVHFLPERSFFSDAFVGVAGVSPLSWFAASLELATAAGVGTAGLLALRAGGWPGGGRFGDGLRHPVALAMIIGNAVIFAASLTQL